MMDKGMWNYYQANYILENKLWEIRSAKFSWKLMRKNGKWPDDDLVSKIYAMDEILREEEHLNMMYFMERMNEGWE